jgi:hypothetical protein
MKKTITTEWYMLHINEHEGLLDHKICCHSTMLCEMDGEDGPQKLRIAVNMMNNQLWRADKR